MKFIILRIILILFILSESYFLFFWISNLISILVTKQDIKSIMDTMEKINKISIMLTINTTIIIGIILFL
jgi:hypothetical protein